MNENATLLATETFVISVAGDDIPECRARAWDALQGALGSQLARDPLDAWVATLLSHGPNPGRFKQQPDGTVVEDKSAPKLACSAQFTREESGRPTFA